MDYMILDTAGNALAAFDDEISARAAIHTIVALQRDAAEHVVLLAYDDDGLPVGDALRVWDVPLPVTLHESCGALFLQRPATVGVSHRAFTEYFGGTSLWGARIDQDNQVPA